MTLRFGSKPSTAATLDGLDEILGKAPKNIAESEWGHMSPVDKIKWHINAAAGPQYLLLGSLLAQRGLSLQPTYSYRDAAKIFGCSVRALQERVRNGELTARDLPGRARFLSADLEEFLRNSKRPSGGQKGRRGQE